MEFIYCLKFNLADRQWRKNDPGKEIIETLIRSTGLWERCTFQATGHYQCDDYDNYFIGKHC
jgi:claudin